MQIKSEKTGRVLSFCGRIAVTGVLLFLLIWKMSFSEVKNILLSVEYGSSVASVLLVFLAVLLSAYKWGILLAARGWGIHVFTLTKIYFVGLFMNNFLPSSIGGDLMRIYQVGRKINNHTEAAASVILERVLATVGLAVPVIIAIIPNYKLLGNFVNTVFWFFVLCAVLVYLCVNPAVLRPLKLISWSWWQKIILKLGEINGAIQSYRSKQVELIKVIIYSVVFQMTIVFINYFLLRGMGIDNVTVWQCTLMVPIISAVSMIPVSVNGLGVREGAYVILFGKLGMSASQSVTLSLLFFTIVTAVSLLGGLIFLVEKQKEEYLVTGEQA